MDALSFLPTEEPAEPRVLSPDEAWDFYMEDQKAKQASFPTGTEENVKYTEKPVQQSGGVTDNSYAFKNTLPPRYRPESPEEAPQERDDIFQTGGFYNPLRGGAESDFLAAIEDPSGPDDGEPTAGFYNPQGGKKDPLFNHFDEHTEDISEAEDPEKKSYLTDKPFVVLKDTKTGTRVKMAREPAQAFFGLQNDLAKMNKADKVSLQESPGTGGGIVSVAKEMVGKEFNPGVGEQCANFVREMCKKAGIEVGASANPIDKHLTGDAQGPGYANSFFGEDVGTLIHDQEDLMPGDIVGFENTYGAYAKGTITHVGIYAGNGKVIDRPTASGAVKMRDVSEFGGISVGVRPYAAGKTGGHVAAHSISVDPDDPDVLKAAAKHGFTPSTGQRGTLTYMGMSTPTFGTGEGETPPIPYESDKDWNSYMEESFNAANQVEIDPSVFLNLVKAESTFNPNAVNESSGAFGLTQLMPETAKEQAMMMGMDVTVEDIKKSPQLQAQIGAGYYKRMLDRFGNHAQAIAAYNVGPNALQNAIDTGQPLPRETINHVVKVLKVSPERAEKLIRNFPGEKMKAESATQVPLEERVVQEPIPNLSEKEQELELGVSFYNPQTPEEDLELIKGLENTKDPLPRAIQNAGVQSKDDAAKEVIARVGATKEEYKRSAGDYGTIANSMLDSTLGMAVGFLDNTVGVGYLRRAIFGDDEEDIASPIFSAMEYVLGNDAQSKDDFNFGRARASNWLKGFVNTFTLGGLNFLSPTGSIYNEKENLARQQLKEAARQQGGLIMNQKPTEKGSFFDGYHNMMVDLGENPLSFVAGGIQMQALAKLGQVRSLVAAAEGTGVSSAAARGIQRTLGFLGGMEATSTTAGGALVQTMTNSALRFEVSQGILGGTEVFNTELAKNLVAAKEGKMDQVEAYTSALGSAAIAGTAGIVLGLGVNYAPGLGKLGVQGVKSMAEDLGQRPLVQAVKASSPAQAVAEKTRWVGEQLGKISNLEKVAHVRQTLKSLGEDGREMWEKHVGKWVTRFSEDLDDSMRKQEYSAESSNYHLLARRKESQAHGTLEIIREAEEAVKLQTNELQVMESTLDQVKSAGGGTAYTKYKTLQEDLQKIEAEGTKIDQQMASVLQTYPDPKAQKVHISILQKRRSQVDSSHSSTTEKLREAKAELNQVVQDTGIQLLSKSGRPRTVTEFEADMDAFSQRIQNMPEQLVLKEADTIKTLHEGYLKAAEVLRERAIKYKEIGDGVAPIPEKPVDPWRAPDEDLSPDTLRNHIEATLDRPGFVLPADRMAEIETLILQQKPLQQTNASMDRFIKDLDAFVEKSPVPTREAWGKRAKELKAKLEGARKTGENAWKVLEDINNGGGQTITDSFVLGNLATRTPNNVKVPLYKLFQESNGSRMALLAKLSQMQQPGGKYVLGTQKLLDDMRLAVDYEGEADPTSEIARAITSMVMKDTLADRSVAAGGTGFMGEVGQTKVTLSGAAKKGYQKFSKSDGDTRTFRERVSEGVAEALASHRTYDFDPFNVVRASSREMLTSKRAYENLGSLVQLAMDDDNGIYKTGIKKFLDGLPNTGIAPSGNTSAIRAEIASLLRSSKNPAEDLGGYISDALFTGDARVGELLRDIPELQGVVQPVVMLHNTLNKLGLITADEKSMADHMYTKAFFPAMKAYDAELKDPSGGSTKILEKIGILEKGKVVASPKTIDDLVEEADDLLGNTYRPDFIKMTPDEKAVAIGKNLNIRDLDGEVIPASPSQVERATAGLLMKGRMRDPGALLKARITSIGNAATQRKFFERLRQTTGPEGKHPLVEVGAPPKGAEDLYRPASSSKNFTPDSYFIDGKYHNNKDIHIRREAFDLFEDLMGDLDIQGVGTERYMRAVNMLALQGLHTPFLMTIGANVWKGFGFNMAKTGKAFTIREDFSPVDWAKIVVRASQAGLEDQSIQQNATLLSKSFLAQNKEVLDEARGEFLRQPGGKEALEHIKRVLAGGPEEGVIGKATRLGGRAVDELIAVDEFLMDNMLFQQLRDAQYGLWMYKANQIEANFLPKMVASGLSPEAARDLAERQAAAFVNTLTGTIEKGITSKTTRGIFGFFGMTPQFTMARLRAVGGSINEDAFRHLPKEIRPRLVNEYRHHLKIMGAAALASSALFQWAASGGQGITDNPANKQMKIKLGNYYVSNPLATITNTISKLTGVQELGRMTSLSVQEAIGMEVPESRINPQESDSFLGAVKGTAYGMGRQIVGQATNLTNPLLRAGISSATGEGVEMLNPEADMGEKFNAMASRISGGYQFLSNTDAFTGEKRPEWIRWVEAFGGMYISENKDVRSHDFEVKGIKANKKATMRRTVKAKLQAAYGMWSKGEKEEAQALFQEAQRLADPGWNFPDGGLELESKQAKRLLRNDPDFNPNDNRLRMKQEEWDNIVHSVWRPREYQVNKATKNTREGAAADVMKQEMLASEANQQAQQSSNPMLNAASGVRNIGKYD